MRLPLPVGARAVMLGALEHLGSVCKLQTEDAMGFFGRSKGEFVEGAQNRNIREKRGRDGTVVTEKQTRSLWGTRFGKWETEKAFPNEKAAHEYSKKRR